MEFFFSFLPYFGRIKKNKINSQITEKQYLEKLSHG